MTPIPLLALVLAFVGIFCLGTLFRNRRWLCLAIVVPACCALSLYITNYGRRGPDRIGTLVAEVVNADRSISLHVQVEPGTTAWYTSEVSVKIPRVGEPAADSADWRVDLHPTERSDAKPLNADAAGRAVVTLPARLVESAPNRAVHVWFNGTDNGTTRLDPPAESEPHAESAERGAPDREAHASRSRKRSSTVEKVCAEESSASRSASRSAARVARFGRSARRANGMLPVRTTCLRKSVTAAENERPMSSRTESHSRLSASSIRSVVVIFDCLSACKLAHSKCECNKNVRHPHFRRSVSTPCISHTFPIIARPDLW